MAEIIVEYIAKTFYDLRPNEGSIVALCGYTDKNYLFSSREDRYVLKIVHEDESIVPLIGWYYHPNISSTSLLSN